MQNVDMDIAYVDSLFSQIEYVDTITLSGGEPSLVPDTLLATLNSAKSHDVAIGNFYIATGTKSPNFRKFMLACLEWYLYCDPNEITAVNWSNDSYHDLNDDNVRLLSALKFASPKYECPDLYSKPNYTYTPKVLDEGRASENGIGDGIVDEEILDIDEDGNVAEGTLYLNCFGMVILGCNWSYESQNEHVLCHVDNLTSAIAEYKVS
jgi:hypothetical protein